MGRKSRDKKSRHLTPRTVTQIESAGNASHDWYIAEGMRGQQLLDQGRIAEATDVFNTILVRLGGAPSYARAVILGRLARCLHVGGQSDLALVQFRQAIDATESLSPTDGVRSLRGILHAEMGDAFRATAQHDRARSAYKAALHIAQTLQDHRAQGVDLGQLGALALAEGELDEARRCYEAALPLFQQAREPAMEATVRQQLAVVCQRSDRPDEAERHYRKAIAVDRQIGNSIGLARHLSSLADLLQNRPGRLAEARSQVEEALRIANALDPRGPEVWNGFGILADITDKEAAAADGPQRIKLQTLASAYRQLQRQAPRILATLDKLTDRSTYGRAVILGRVGRCFHLSGRLDLAVAQFRDALDATRRIEAGDDVQGLRGTLQSELGEALLAAGHYDEARNAFEAALRIADELQDLRGQDIASRHLAAVALAQGSTEEARRYRESHSATLVEVNVKPAARPTTAEIAGLPVPFGITLHEDASTDYVFDTDLLVDGRRETKILPWTAEAATPADEVRPVLVPSARVCMDHDQAVRVCLPPGEPILERHPDCTIMRRILRDVVVSGNSHIVWHLIRTMDGTSTTAAIVDELATHERPIARRILAALAATGAIDISGRPLGRFLHLATKKGVLPGGGLESDEVLRLATDANYRAYPGTPQIAVRESVPDRLREFHSLTRSRRSRRNYQGRPLRRDELDALLHTACGVTGSMPWAGGEVTLRAYPASGALYAVEIYPVVLRVEDLQPAVYHYRPVENVLELVRPRIDRARFIGTMLLLN